MQVLITSHMLLQDAASSCRDYLIGGIASFNAPIWAWHACGSPMHKLMPDRELGLCVGATSSQELAKQ